MSTSRDGRSRGVPVVAAVAFWCATSGCASRPPQAAPVAAMPERVAAYAHPEPDPACRAMVQESLASNGLDRVVVKLGREPAGNVRVLEFLAPDLSPAAKVELTRAFGECAWAPPVSPQPRPAAEVWTDTVAREPAAPAR